MELHRLHCCVAPVVSKDACGLDLHTDSNKHEAAGGHVGPSSYFVATGTDYFGCDATNDCAIQMTCKCEGDVGNRFPTPRSWLDRQSDMVLMVYTAAHAFKCAVARLHLVVKSCTSKQKIWRYRQHNKRSQHTEWIPEPDAMHHRREHRRS